MPRLADLGEWERDLLLQMLKEIPDFKGQPWVEGPPLAQRKVAIITTSGIHRRDDDAYSDGAAASEYRVIPSDVQVSDLVMSHLSSNYDRTGFQQDANVVFPIDRLRELAAASLIGSVAGGF